MQAEQAALIGRVDTRHDVENRRRIECAIAVCADTARFLDHVERLIVASRNHTDRLLGACEFDGGDLHVGTRRNGPARPRRAALAEGDLAL